MAFRDFIPFPAEANKLAKIKKKSVAQTIQIDDQKVMARLFKAIGLAIGFTGGTYVGLRINFEPAPYDFDRIIQAIDTDSYAKQAFNKYSELMWKEGWDIVGENPDAVDYLYQRIAFMELAMRQPFQNFLVEIADQLVKFGNCFIVKVRNERIKEYFPYPLGTPADLKPPVVGYQIIPAETMEIMRDYHNKIKLYRQNIWGNAGAGAGFARADKWSANLLPTWKPDEVVHLYFDRRPGRIFGTPFIISVMDDIVALRQIEEDIQNLVHRELFPFYKYKVGTEEHPAEPEEIEQAVVELEHMRGEGGMVLPDRHDIEVIGAEGKAMDAGSYLQHFKERVCFPAGTLIRMSDGSHCKIEDVRLLDMVVTAEGGQGQVMQTMVNHTSGLIRLRLYGHNALRCTPEHPILTKRGYIAAKELEIGDQVALTRFHPSEHQWIEPQSVIDARIFRGVKEGTVNRRGITHIITALPDTIRLTPEFGRIIGLYAAEGHSDVNMVRWTFGGHEEYTLAAETIDLLKTVFGVQARLSRRNGAVIVSLYGKAWKLLFEALVPGTARHGDKRLSHYVTSGSHEYLSALWAGWIDGDGYRRRSTVEGITVSKQLALDMYAIAQDLGYKPTLNVSAPSMNKYAATRQMRWSVSHGRGDTDRQRCIMTNEAVWRKVTSIEEEDFQGPVYNLHVEGDESYVADGVGVHNCVGLGLSPHHLGMMMEGGNRSVTDRLDIALYDKVKKYQRYLAAKIQLDVFNELLLEGGFDPYMIPDDETKSDRCTFEFNEIDVDTQVKKENNILEKWNRDVLMQPETRIALGLKPEVDEDQLYTAQSNRMLPAPGKPVLGGSAPGSVSKDDVKQQQQALGAAPKSLNPPSAPNKGSSGGINNAPNKPDAVNPSAGGMANRPNNKAVSNKSRPANQYGRRSSPNIRHMIQDDWLQETVDLLDGEILE